MCSLKLVCNFGLQASLCDSRLFSHCDVQVPTRPECCSLRKVDVKSGPVSRTNSTNNPGCGRNMPLPGLVIVTSQICVKSIMPCHFDPCFELPFPCFEHPCQQCLLQYQGFRPLPRRLYRQFGSCKSASREGYKSRLTGG